MKALAAEIGRALLMPDPDLRGLPGRLEAAGALSGADAQRLIYLVAGELNSRFFPPVTKLELVLTERCNLECAYCFEKPLRGARDMTPAVARAAIDLLIDYSADRRELDITHFGGEPLLNLPTLVAATEYAEARAAAAGKSIAFNITTNGLLLDQRLLEYLAGHDIKVLLSMDGMGPSHDRYRRDGEGRGTFDRVVKALRLLKSYQPWVGAKVTVMPENVSRLFDDVRDLYLLGVNQFLIGHATGVQWAGEDVALYEDQMRRLHVWYSHGERRSIRITEFEAGDGPVPRFGCQAGRDSLSIAVDGAISSCSKVLALDKMRPLAKLGEVGTGLTHLANRAQLVACTPLRSACEELGIADEYCGGCLASNYEENGDLFWPSLLDHAFSRLRRGRGERNDEAPATAEPPTAQEAMV